MEFIIAERAIAANSDYYAGIDMNATNDVLRGQLQNLIDQKGVISYDGVW